MTKVKILHFDNDLSINKEKLQAISALINADRTYLVMFEDNCQMYNGIDIQNDKDWQQIAKGIDTLIDIMIKE